MAATATGARLKSTSLPKETTTFHELLARLADEHHRELALVRDELAAKIRSRQSALRAENRVLRRQLAGNPDNEEVACAQEEDGELMVQSLAPYGKVLEPSNAMLTSPISSPRVGEVSTPRAANLLSEFSPEVGVNEKEETGDMPEVMQESDSAAMQKTFPTSRLSAALPRKDFNKEDGEGFINLDDSEEKTEVSNLKNATLVSQPSQSSLYFEREDLSDTLTPAIAKHDSSARWFPSVRDEQMWSVHEIWLVEDIKTVITESTFKRKVAKSQQVAIPMESSQDCQGRRGCRECMQPFIASPSNPFRLVWDLLGMALISYDVIMIPMGLFNPPETTFLTTMNHITMFFWTADIAASFFVGFVRKGATVMEPRAIAMRYAKTWMVADLIVVCADWVNYLATLGREKDSDNVGGVGRFLRGLRAFRTLRLVRLLKLKRIMAVIEDHIESEYMAIVGEILKLLVCMLVLSHLVACIFYLLGDNGEEGENWLESNKLTGKNWEYQYTTSLHWSLTQLMLESMDISATSITERIYTICTLVFGLIVFSSVVSRVTSSMIQLQNMHDNTSKQFWLLRRYFRERSVPKTLAARIQRFLEYSIQQAQQHVQEANVKILGLLSNQLHDELQYAISVPHLGLHPFFAHISKVSDVVMYRLSSAAISRRSLACDDSLFFQGEVASSMFFVVTGELAYIKEALDDIVSVRQEDWICEPALWTTWSHLGDLHATTECDLIVMAAQTFAEVMRSNPLIWQLASLYAKAFVRKLNSTNREEMVDVARIAPPQPPPLARLMSSDALGSSAPLRASVHLLGWSTNNNRASGSASLDIDESQKLNIASIQELSIPSMALNKLARSPLKRY